jgi:hypothetical protein
MPPNFLGGFLPTEAQNPKVTLPANFNSVLGFAVNFTTNSNVGTDKPKTSNQNVSINSVTGVLTYYSSQAPNLQSNSSVNFVLDMVNNDLGNPSGLLYTLTPTVGVAAIFSEKPPQLQFCRLFDGRYSQLRLTLVDSNFTPMNIRDPNMTFTFLIRDILP